MTRDEVFKLLAVIEAAYPKGEFPKERAEIYARFLRDLDYKAASAAVTKLIATSKFVPTIADIRSAVAELTAGIPEPEEALEEVVEAARRGRYEFSHPAVKRAVDALGWEYIQYSEDPGVWRSQFLRLYGPIRERELIRHQTQGVLPGGQLQALPGGRSA